MTGITKGPWVAVGAMVESPRDDIADICSCNPASFGQEGANLKPRSYAEMVANAEAIAAIPAMVEALRWALSMAEEAILVRENGDDPEDTPDICEMHRAELERHRAILSRIDGAGDTLPDAPVPAPIGEYRVRYASTIIRRNAEPRFAVFDSEKDLADDLREYARDVLDLEVSDLADIQELADRIGQETRESVYWGEC